MKLISLKAFFSTAALVALANIAYTQCGTDNATCVGSDCTTLGDGAVEYATDETSDNITAPSPVPSIRRRTTVSASRWNRKATRKTVATAPRSSPTPAQRAPTSG